MCEIELPLSKDMWPRVCECEDYPKCQRKRQPCEDPVDTHEWEFIEIIDYKSFDKYKELNQCKLCKKIKVIRIE